MNLNQLSRRMVDRFHSGINIYRPRNPRQIDVVRLSQYIQARNPTVGLFISPESYELRQVRPYRK